MAEIASLVLCAGLGTRLAPLTAWRAKPLVPVGDRPAVGHVVERVRPVSRVVVVNAHHRAEDVEAYARANGLVVSREDELLGTAGAVSHARARLGEGDVLVWNGDMLGAPDVAGLVARHARAAARGGVATMLVAPRADGGGNVGIDAEGWVTRIRREASRPGEVRSADFLGVHVLGPALRRACPPSGDIVSTAYLPLLAEGARVAALDCDARFVDIGTPRAYLEANRAWLAERGLRAWAHPTARVEAGVLLEGSIVGEGAVVRGEGALADCVVWPRAEARAPLARHVVALEGAVAVGLDGEEP